MYPERKHKTVCPKCKGAKFVYRPVRTVCNECGAEGWVYRAGPQRRKASNAK